jgi:FkbM family methyltransferase
MDGLLPVVPTVEERDGWSERRPRAFSLALAWSRRSPRAKSWVPRQIGRLSGARWKTAIRSANGTVLAVDPANLDVYVQIARDGAVDPWVLDTCLRLLEPGDVFFDIGANAGFISLSVGAHFGDSTTVVAFEPQPGLARRIAVSAHLNGLENCTVFETMLGASDGTATLHLSAHALHASAIARDPGAAAIARSIAQLDTLIAGGAVPVPSLIKIDVEGAELRVLQGAQRLLRENEPLLVFEADTNMERFGYGRNELLGYIRSCADYSFWGIRPDGSLGDVHDDAVRDIFASTRRRELQRPTRVSNMHARDAFIP